MMVESNHGLVGKLTEPKVISSRASMSASLPLTLIAGGDGGEKSGEAAIDIL